MNVIKLELNYCHCAQYTFALQFYRLGLIVHQ